MIDFLSVTGNRSKIIKNFLIGGHYVLSKMQSRIQRGFFKMYRL